MPYEPYVGQIMPAAFQNPPRGWALCNGALLSIPQNAALFSLLGTSYGGNGTTNFALPDLRGRAVLGSDLTKIPPGAIGGTETVTLGSAEMPAHRHDIEAAITTGTGRGVTPDGRLFGTNQAPANAIFGPPSGPAVALAPAANVLPTGGHNAHNNMQPYLVISYFIALAGIFPARP